MNKNLYVGNLSAKVTEEDLKSNFSRAGEVVSVNISRDRAQVCATLSPDATPKAPNEIP